MNIQQQYTSSQLSNPVDPTFAIKDIESDLFNYTHGRFLANEALRLKERRRIFNIHGLFRIVSTAMHCDTEDIVDFRKLAEGGFNRVFLITLRNGSRLVVRIPYPSTVPIAHSLASEVATMDFLRSKGLPIPKIYGYSFSPQNDAEAEYTLMEYIESPNLNEIWHSLNEDQIITLMDQLTKLENAMMSISFPAGGSIYYARDLKNLSGNEGIPLDGQTESTTYTGDQFCIGPDVSSAFWYGRREHLDVFRGPYKDALSALTAGAEKELSYLKKFGSPRLPYNRVRRDCYDYKKQSPLDHIKNLERYLLVAPSLVPDDESLSKFCLRHPDITVNNIKISTGSEGLQIVSLLDWQSTVVYPLFLASGVPNQIRSKNDVASEELKYPELPENFDELSETEQEDERDVLRLRLIYYHYYYKTLENNKIHYHGLSYSLGDLCRFPYRRSCEIWRGETIELFNELMDVVFNWELFSKDGAPCPVFVSEDERAAAAKLYNDTLLAGWVEQEMNAQIGCGADTWVPAGNYEQAKEISQQLKKDTLKRQKGETAEEMIAFIDANWYYDDMDKKEIEELF